MNVQPFDFSVDLLHALLWQYSDAPRLQALLQSKQDWYDEAQESFWSSWLTDVFDLTTANAFGLNVWAKILGIPLVVIAQPQAAKPLWGFSANRVDFNQGNFTAVGTVATLTTDQARLVLRLRYYQLTTRATVPEVNAALADVFGAGPYVRKAANYALEYVFPVALIPSAVELVLTQFDILPRPAGMTAAIVKV